MQEASGTGVQRRRGVVGHTGPRKPWEGLRLYLICSQGHWKGKRRGEA